MSKRDSPGGLFNCDRAVRTSPVLPFQIAGVAPWVWRVYPVSFEWLILDLCMSKVSDFGSFYAQYVVRNGDCSSASVERAFATVPRETFLGPGPWDVLVAGDYIRTPTSDPRHVYQNVLVALARERGINNGEPSLHAMCFHALGLKPGEHLIHVGAGTGYYTAIAAELVGSSGRITAYEIEPDLADRARANLRAWPIAAVITAGREVEPLPSADAIYVNAAATFPHHVWLNALNDDGRLLFPLTPTDEIGGMLLVTKVDEAKFSARFLCPARFISMVAAQNPTNSRMLSQAFSRGDIGSVRSLRIGTRPDDSAWCIGEGWWLSVEDESSKGARLD